MRLSKSKVYWIALSFVLLTGIFLIYNVPQNGYVYAYIMLFSFWIIVYLVRKNQK